MKLTELICCGFIPAGLDWKIGDAAGQPGGSRPGIRPAKMLA